MNQSDSYAILARHYDAAYANKQFLADVPFYVELAKQSGGPVLEIACGTGRVLPVSYTHLRSNRAKVSPRTALRTWPMCAALFGLMLVCSTTVLGAFATGEADSCPASSQAARKKLARSKKKFR